MVITLTDTGKNSTTDNKLYFPVNPGQVNYKTATYFQEYNILKKGPAKVPEGEDITTIGWESFFPGAKLKSQPYVKKYRDAKVFHSMLNSWKNKGAKLKLNITGTPFSCWVYIDTYEASAQDAFGSIYYKIEFSKVVEVSVETVKKKKSTSKAKTSGNSRTSKKSSAKKHTVKKGDTLWAIGKKYYKKASMANCNKIYNANKTTIEKVAKKHGKKSSQKGKWIWPGTVLKIP